MRNGDVKELPNTHEHPANEFRMDVSAAGVPIEEIIATWHTHSHGSANLSVKDYVAFQKYPDWEHYIVGRDEVRRYMVDGIKVFMYDDETNSF